MDDVGDGQRMQAVALAEGANQLDVGEALDVDPDFRRVGRPGSTSASVLPSRSTRCSAS
jgi:hypothetical protein